MSGDPEISVELRYSVQLTIFVGLGVIFIALFFKWIRKDDASASGSSKNDKPEKQKSSSGESSSKHGKKEQASSVKASSKKKLTERENRRNMRTNEKGITPPWFLGKYKGHTGNVSGMDLAANGKFIASCSDEERAASQDNSTSAAESTKDNAEASSQSTSPVLSKSLSRRQKKNRKIVKEHQSKPVKPSRTAANDLPHAHVKRLRRQTLTDDIEPLEEYTKIQIPTDHLVLMLKNYCLDPGSMSTLGYPVKKPKLPNNTLTHRKSYALDVHAEEFVPRKDSEKDSGNGSVSGNSSEEETSSTNSDMSPANNQSALNPGTIKMKDRQYRLCVRCGKYFYVSSKSYITMESCLYHWGKLELNNKGYGPMAYSCCSAQRGAVGCSLGKLHVSLGPPKLFVNSTFVETEPPKRRKKNNNYGVYGLDCEMSYTIAGLEAVKVTLVDITGRPVYNEFVQPKNKIIDFNTRFSGIDEEIFSKNKPKSLAQVQRELKKFISSETIVIGHGLENDFKALHMVHKTVVDTAYTFPHHRGLPYKRSLKSITKSFLKRDIQCGDNGHDSVEDSRACVELMLYRVRLDYKL